MAVSWVNSSARLELTYIINTEIKIKKLKIKLLMSFKYCNNYVYMKKLLSKIVISTDVEHNFNLKINNFTPSFKKVT